MSERGLSTETQLILLGLLGVGLYVWAKGGVASAAGSVAETAAEAAGNVVTGAATGVVTAASKTVGLPTPAQTTDDPAVARWIMDHPNGGQFAASEWASVPALARAEFMAVGSGHPPPEGTDLYAAFPPLSAPQPAYTGGATGTW